MWCGCSLRWKNELSLSGACKDPSDPFGDPPAIRDVKLVLTANLWWLGKGSFSGTLGTDPPSRVTGGPALMFFPCQRKPQ